MDLSIIIINWHSADYIKKCLLTIYENLKDLTFEVIIVDNASYDISEQFLKKQHPGIIYVQSPENIGFGRANNLGFKYSSGEYLLFLNPDTEITDSAINIMFNYMQSLSNAGVVGCKLLNSDTSIQTSCIRAFPTILNQSLDSDYLKLTFRKLDLWGIKPLFDNDPNPVEVDVISGACIMIRRGVFEEIGLFSRDYFMYSEDVDLCYRVKQKGYKIYYIGGAIIIHHGGGSSETISDFYSTLVKQESRIIFFNKTKGKLYATIYKMSMFFVSIARIMIILTMLPVERLLLKKNINLPHALKKNIKLLKWTIGLEEWTKQLEYNRSSDAIT